jgi:hydroxymethylglutaryl-CoA synthase
MTKKDYSVGISGLAVYLPPLRVQLRDWCDWTGNSWSKIEQVVGRSFRVTGPRHSVYTMAATAAWRLIQQYDIDPQRVGFLGLGTESSTDNSAGPIIIKGMLDDALAANGKPRLSRGCEVPEFKHACLGGVYAMKGALRYLSTDGRGKQAIVICSDIAEYARGSSGEPTQGAGAVAMLIEQDPTLVSVSLDQSGSASAYRTMDFRKPMLRFCGQSTDADPRIQDFPVFNGKYSTTCYIDETLHALRDMYTRRGICGADYLQSLRYIFMHRPYRRMPETALGYAYLAALAGGRDEHRAELAGYAAAASVDLTALIDELNGTPDVTAVANEQQLNTEVYPLAAATLYGFRNSPAYAEQVLDRLSLGLESICDFGNLYTAALPAWLAAGFEIALNSDTDLTGEELLTMGYGSGDAAEVIPFTVQAEWQAAASRIGFQDAMQGAVDLTQSQYERLHDRQPVSELKPDASDEFLVAGIGDVDSRHFRNIGIEYHRYVEARPHLRSA